MKIFRILIVEDEPWIAMDLEMIIIELVTATVVIERSIAGTKEVLHKALDFAFLDVEVTDGKTFEIAQILEHKRVPFVFVSGSPQDRLPFELRSVPFIPKPFDAAQIESALQAAAEERFSCAWVLNRRPRPGGAHGWLSNV
jgi:DNA-binding LytR/AlgR family response regulator